MSVGGISGYTDLNNAVDNGLWRLGTSITNGPVGMSVDNGQLIVSCNSDTAFQIVTDATNEPNGMAHGHRHRRHAVLESVEGG